MRTYKFLMATVAAFMFMIASQANAIQILGTGSGALLGNDLTDVGGDGNEGAYSLGGSTAYNIQNIHNTTNTLINYGGGGGDFGANVGYGTIGAGLGGDDFSVRGITNIKFANAGQFSIAAGSDDGRRIELLGGKTWDAVGGQQTGGLGANPVIQFENPTGHNRTTGVLTVAAGEVVGIDTSFWERGGGDSFEVSIKAGNDTGFGGVGDGWALLQTGGAAGVTIGTDAGATNNNWNISAYNIVGGGGSTDNDINNTTEAQSLWNAIDGGQGTGLANIVNPVNLAGFDAKFFSSNEPGFGGGEFAFNVFDDDVGGGNNKWCCGAGGGNPITPQIVGAKDFVSLEGAIELTHFTLTSGNDSTQRDPRGFSIQGSNNTTDGLDGDWTDIFVRVDDGTSDWTARNQVIGYGGMFGDTFLTSEGFTAFRMVTTSTGATGGAFFQLNEIELFGVQSVPEPTTALLGLMGMAGLATRRRRREA